MRSKTQCRLAGPTSELAGAYHNKVVREFQIEQEKPRRIEETRSEAEVARDLRIGKRADGTFKRGLPWLRSAR